MPKTAHAVKTYRFDQMATMINDRVDDPAESGVERYVGLEHLDADSLKIRRWGDITDVASTKLRFKPGDIIFGKRRVYQRKLAVADFEGICSAHAMVLRARPETVLPDFLPFFMQSDLFMDCALAISVGSLSPTINWTDLAQQEFVLPPIDEQRRMVEALVGITALSDSLFRLAHCLDNIEVALLRDTFGSAYSAPNASLPLVELAQLAEVRTGMAKGRAPDRATTTKPYLAVSNVKDGYLDLSSIKDIVVERDRVSRYELRRGDVLMTEGGDLDKLGRGTVWEDEIPGCLHQNHVFAVRANADKLDPWYLAALARSPYGRSFFLGCAKRSSNLASINKSQVSAFRVPLMPLREQRQWVSCYRSIRSQQTCARERLRQGTSLLKTVTSIGGRA
jgi:hypothetical protein